jgi:hypothetical protein
MNEDNTIKVAATIRCNEPECASDIASLMAVLQALVGLVDTETGKAPEVIFSPAAVKIIGSKEIEAEAMRRIANL